MFSLAVRSIRHRAGGFAASMLTLLFGATILMSFASLLDTAAAIDTAIDTAIDAAADPATVKTLTIMAAVVGGWGLVIVTFAVGSTLSLLIWQRADEMTLLRTIGATPAQIRRLLLGETMILAVAAALIAVAPSVFTGRLLVDLLTRAGRVPAGTTAVFGPIALGIGLGVTLLAAVLGALLAARRAASPRPTTSSGKARLIAGAVTLCAGISCAVVTMTVFDGTEQALMAVGGQGAILCAVGLALLAPGIITATGRLARPLRRTGATGYLAVLNLHGHTRQFAAALGPIILFTAIATGTISMQRVEDTAGTMPAEIAGTIETLNYVVVGMIALFAAVMLINTVVAATLHRRREFGQLRLAGSTRPQVLGMVGREAGVLAAAGVLTGTIAATATVIPFSVAKTDSLLPDTTITVYLGVVLTAALITLLASLISARRATHTPPIATIRAE